MKTKCLLSALILLLTFFTNKMLFADLDCQRNISCMKELDFSQLTGRVVTAADPGYNAARLGWNLYYSRYPLAIVFVQNKQDILNALKFCHDNKISCRIRSHRHAIEGWSVADQVIVIDDSEMTNVKIDRKRRLAFVGPGLTQMQAVVALGEAGFRVPTGIENSVGLTGATLGGGIGMSIREFGLACDHLVEVEMILASGKVVRATENNKYKDILFACRGGGGGNIGIVTEFVYSLIPSGNVTLYEISYPYETLEILVDTWQHWAPFQTKRLNSVMELFKTGHTVSGIFNGSQEELSELLKPILAIPGSTLTAFATVPYPEAWLFFANEQDTTPEFDKFSSTFAYKLLPPEAIRIIKDAMDNSVNENADFFFLALGGVMKKTPTDATPFFNRKAKFYFEWDSPWDNVLHPEQAGPSMAWVENLQLDMQPFSFGSYVNVPNMATLNWREAYYGRKNYNKLTQIKRKYDPKHFFTYEIQAIELKKVDITPDKHKSSCHK